MFEPTKHDLNKVQMSIKMKKNNNNYVTTACKQDSLICWHCCDKTTNLTSLMHSILLHQGDVSFCLERMNFPSTACSSYVICYTLWLLRGVIYLTLQLLYCRLPESHCEQDDQQIHQFPLVSTLGNGVDMETIMPLAIAFPHFFSMCSVQKMQDTDYSNSKLPSSWQFAVCLIKNDTSITVPFFLSGWWIASSSILLWLTFIMDNYAPYNLSDSRVALMQRGSRSTWINV